MKTEEIVKKHKAGELSYNEGLKLLEAKGMKQIDAHNLLFPPFPNKDDWQMEPPSNLGGLGYE